MTAGTDVECGFGYAYEKLPEAVRAGLITEEEIDRHVVRLLEARFELGEMDDHDACEWSRIPVSVLSSKEHRELSLDMARQSIVLLQNRNNILPLSKGEKIAVIGPNADNTPMMWGNYNGTKHDRHHCRRSERKGGEEEYGIPEGLRPDRGMCREQFPHTM